MTVEITRDARQRPSGHRREATVWWNRKEWNGIKWNGK
jgi:hypothetical protein